MSGADSNGEAEGAEVSELPSFELGADRVAKGQLLMAGLGEEIRGLWDTLCRVEASPVPGGRLDIADNSILDILNWLRRALTTIRSLDHEVFSNSDSETYEVLYKTDLRGMTVRGLIAPRNNAVHHPEVVDPGVDRAMGPLEDGRYFIFPTWVRRTIALEPMFTFQGKVSKSYKRAYDNHIAERTLLDPLMDAFDFFDSLAPDLARRDGDGQLAHFPLPPPPIAAPHVYFRLAPDWPSERDRRRTLDDELRLAVTSSPPAGQQREISGAFHTEDGELVLTGYTTVTATYRHLFLEQPDQVQEDIRSGYRYVLATAPSTERTDQVEVTPDLTLADGRPLPVDDLVAAGADRAEISAGQWGLCQKDAHYYAGFRRGGG